MQPQRIPDVVPEDSRIAQVRSLLGHLERGEESDANRVLGDLTRDHDQSLFHEIGKLTRDLHEALNAFRHDTRLASLANVDIPDAKQRLNYVIDMTEQAASRTLNAIEGARPACERLRTDASILHADWQKFTQRRMDVAEFRALSKKLDEFLPWAVQCAGQVEGNLNDVLMAQSFQDLTGQIIRRVIKLVEELELNLVNLVRISGQKQNLTPELAKSGDGLDGPQVPGLKHADAVSGQDEVDDLLSSLGF